LPAVLGDEKFQEESPKRYASGLTDSVSFLRKIASAMGDRQVLPTEEIAELE